MKRLTVAIVVGIMLVAAGCAYEKDSDEQQRAQQEQLLQEGTKQVGMPAIKNFRERKLLKQILELRDQEGLITYTYISNDFPQIVEGKTALGGKLTFLGTTVGYGLPYATQFTNPEKEVHWRGVATLPQADPTGLFTPESAEGTWILMYDEEEGKSLPVYVEPRIVVTPSKLPFD
jgi:hypothetical protein